MSRMNQSLADKFYEEAQWEADSKTTKRDIAEAMLEASFRLLRASDPQDEINAAYQRGLEEGTRQAIAKLKAGLPKELKENTNDRN
jgi:hypothetical protein